MRIGFCGAHRTGKTTLALAIAAATNTNMISSSVSAIAKRYGFDMDNDNRLDAHFFEMQTEILDTFEDAFREQKAFVSDRTPIDAAAYLMADMTADAGDEAFQESVLRYVDRAVRLTDELFDVVILVPPGLTYDAADGKPGANMAYQEHHHLLCAGILGDSITPSGSLERDNLDLNNRLRASQAFIMEATKSKRALNLIVGRKV